jgi:hypothetical protein
MKYKNMRECRRKGWMPIAHVVFIIIGVVFGISAIARCYLMCCRSKK